jgi:hypothetical protein
MERQLGAWLTWRRPACRKFSHQGSVDPGSHAAAPSAGQDVCSIACGSDGVCEPTPPVIARKAVGMRFIDGQPDERMRNGANFTTFLPELISRFDEKIGSHK